MDTNLLNIYAGFRNLAKLYFSKSLSVVSFQEGKVNFLVFEEGEVIPRNESFVAALELLCEEDGLAADALICELECVSSLRNALWEMKNWAPYPDIRLYEEYKFCLWFAIISEGFVAGSSTEIDLLITECRHLVEKWKRVICNTFPMEHNSDSIKLFELFHVAGIRFLQMEKPRYDDNDM